MSENDYLWMAALYAALGQQDKKPSPEGPRQLRDVYAQAGTFDNADSPAANDLLAALTALLVLYLISAIYRANLTVFANFCTKRSQNKKVPFSSPDPAQSLSTAGFPETKGFFWVLLTLCQLNSTLTAV
jgi:hypothetical protein